MIYKKYIISIFLTIFILTEVAFAAPQDDFVIKVHTTNANENFTFYTLDNDYDVDWDNDGVFDQNNLSLDVTYQFTNPGYHIIRFRNLQNIHINNQADKDKYISIEQ